MNRQHQQGLSMVELLVALAISSFLILGITQVYIDNKRSYFFQQGQMETNESLRFLTYILDNEFHKIGYRREPYLSYESIFKVDDVFLRAGQTIKFISLNEVRFRYQPNSSKDYGCDGVSEEGSYIDNIYFDDKEKPIVRVVTIFFDKNNSVVRCNGEEIVTGVADFRIMYAVPVNINNENQGVKYVSQVSESDKVKGIRYEVLAGSTMRNLSDSSNSSAVDAFYEKNEDKPDDKAVYQFVSKTVMFRNLMVW